MTGIPASIALQEIAHGRVAATGVMGPEQAFEPEAFFGELARRRIAIERSWSWVVLEEARVEAFEAQPDCVEGQKSPSVGAEEH